MIQESGTGVSVSLTAAEALNFARDGAQLFPAAIDRTTLGVIKTLAGDLPPHKAGIRLRGAEELRALLAATGSVGAVAATVLGAECRPVRAILFDKTPQLNWSLRWHQDRTIAVTERRDVEGFDPWSIKDGLLHVAPPFSVLANIVTLRVHLDPVPETNAPLLVAPGSHSLGRIPEPAIADAVQKCGTVACSAGRGDVWLYSTPILHASNAASVPCRRRVLQVDYASEELPGGLKWLGI